jgi:hypothetical protein
MLGTSDCMRRHGISGFPDPTAAAPSNSDDYGAVVAGGGYYLAIPKSVDINSPAFGRAAAACNFGPGR